MGRIKTKHIDRPNSGYSILRSYVCFVLKKVFYKRVTVTFEQKISHDVPVVFAANHQNALIDALLIICSTPRQPVFFARADIFKKPLLRKILTFLRIAPLFRIRDGRETLHQNAESFDLATGILLRNNSIGIFPEGTHNDREQLIPLKKGMARMVLMAEQVSDFKLGVCVIPVSIAYVDYIRPRTEVRVHFGKPLTFMHLKELYETNPSLALVKFNEEFETALKEIVIHVDSRESYVLVQNMRKSVILDKLGDKSGLRESYQAAQEFISKINVQQKTHPEITAGIFEKADQYFTNLKKHGITEPILFKGGISFVTSFMIGLLLFTGLPLYIAGRLLNYLPFMVFYRFVNKKIEDTQFRSSVYFTATALFVAPLMYIIQTVIACIFLPHLWMCFAVFPLMLVLGIFAYQYLKFWNWSMLRWKANIFIRRHADAKKDLMELRMQMMDAIKVL